jgi:hypothetical protein
MITIINTDIKILQFRRPVSRLEGLLAFITVIALFLLSPLSVRAQSELDKQKLSELEGKVVKIGECTDSNSNCGAGFLVTNYGHVITAKHVIQPYTDVGRPGQSFTVQVSFIDDQRARVARVLAVDDFFDLAVLKLDVESASLPLPVEFGDSDSVSGGQSLTVIGHTFDPDRTPSRQCFDESTLKVSNSNSNGLIILTGQLFGGNSGGPAFDNSGKVVGVAMEKSGGNGYVLPIYYVRHFLQSVGINVDPKTPVNYYNQEIQKLNHELEKYERMLHWFKSDLVWNASLDWATITSNTQEGKNERLVEQQLIIEYNKKNDDQYSPVEINVTVCPILKGQSSEDEAKYCFERSREFHGARQVRIPDLQGSLKPQIKGKGEIEEIEQLVIFVEPTILQNGKESNLPKRKIVSIKYSIEPPQGR